MFHFLADRKAEQGDRPSRKQAYLTAEFGMDLQNSFCGFSCY